MGVALTGSQPRFPPAPITAHVPRATSTDPNPLTLSPVSSIKEFFDDVLDVDLPRPSPRHGEGHKPFDPTNQPSQLVHPTNKESLEQQVSSQPSQPLTVYTSFEDPFTMPSTNRARRDKATAMFEVGRFALIVYPKLRWRSFPTNGSKQDLAVRIAVE